MYKPLDPAEEVPLRGDDLITDVDDPCNERSGEQLAGGWAKGGSQRPTQRGSGGVDAAVGIRDVQGSSALGCWECGQEWIGLGAVEIEQKEGVAAVEAAQDPGAHAAEGARAVVEDDRAVPHPIPLLLAREGSTAVRPLTLTLSRGGEREPGRRLVLSGSED